MAKSLYMTQQRCNDWLSSYGTTKNRNRYFNGPTATADFCHLWFEWDGIFLQTFLVTTEYENGKTAQYSSRIMAT